MKPDHARRKGDVDRDIDRTLVELVDVLAHPASERPQRPHGAFKVA